MEAVLVALIVGGLAILGNWLMKRQDYARQDEVAARAKEAAKEAAQEVKKVADQAAETARLLLERQDAVDARDAAAAELLVAANEKLGTKLEQIHTLVNSSMTEALQGELEATIRELALLREVVTLKQVAGHEPSAEAIEAIENTDHKVQELRAAQNDRLLQTRVADAQIARHA